MRGVVLHHLLSELPVDRAVSCRGWNSTHVALEASLQQAYLWCTEGAGHGAVDRGSTSDWLAGHDASVVRVCESHRCDRSRDTCRNRGCRSHTLQRALICPAICALWIGWAIGAPV